MLIFFLIITTILGLLIKDDFYCECEDLQYEGDCRQSNCLWIYDEIEILSNPTIKQTSYGSLKFVNQENFEVISKGYSIKQFISCSQQKQEQCHYIYCTWNQSQGCKDFTCCNDYQTASQDGCQEIHDICINGDFINDMFVCKELTVENCSSQINADICNYYYQFDDKSCYFSDNICKAYYVYECYDAINEVLCPSYCTWTENGCIQKQCSNLKNKDECQFVFEFGLDIQICQFNGIECVEVTDISQLTKEDCNRNSYYRFYWKDDICYQYQRVYAERVNNYSFLLLFSLIQYQL